MSESEQTSHPRFFGRRKGRPLSANMQRLLDHILPQFSIAPSEQTLNLDSLSASRGKIYDRLVLEIGFGGGEHLAQQASAHPDTLFIGAEPFINGVVSLARQIEDNRLENILIWPDDVRIMLGRLAPAALDGCYILFPDPWPKARHSGRRIVNQAMLDILSQTIKPSGFLRMASDHPVAQSWLLAESLNHGQFFWTASCASDWRQRPDGWPETRYMAKGVREGRASVWFDFARR
ncbi:MAG: tRNA (guanine(46)-N(7))-methyltransferase TrmB [Candidatus Puniceispirillaceae bacterium]